MYCGGVNGGRVWFQGLIYPYVKNYQLFVCPSFSGGAFHAPAYAGVPNSTVCPNGEPDSIRFKTGVGKNWYNNSTPAYTGDAGHWNDWLSQGALLWPAELVEYGDSDCIVMGPQNSNSIPGFLAGTSGPAGYFRHNDGMNASFADGHVKWMKPSNGTYRNVYYNAP
jgi:prepilin-type processing-associated H-X9-DG protein